MSNNPYWTARALRIFQFCGRGVKKKFDFYRVGGDATVCCPEKFSHHPTFFDLLIFSTPLKNSITANCCKLTSPPPPVPPLCKFSFGISTSFQKSIFRTLYVFFAFAEPSFSAKPLVIFEGQWILFYFFLVWKFVQFFFVFPRYLEATVRMTVFNALQRKKIVAL